MLLFKNRFVRGPHRSRLFHIKAERREVLLAVTARGEVGMLIERLRKKGLNDFDPMELLAVAMAAGSMIYGRGRGRGHVGSCEWISG